MNERDKTARAEFVAAMRKVADLVEADESLPVPFHAQMQAGFFGTHIDGIYKQLTPREKRAALRAFAERLGVDVVEDSDGSRTATLQVGVLGYFVNIGPEPHRLEDGKRVVPAAEDEQFAEVAA